MKKNFRTDAFGHYLWDCYKNGPVPQIVERDDGYIGDGSLNYFSEHNRWPAHVQQALRHVQGRVLDVGCGAGQHATYLQTQGFGVTGIDSSPLAVKLCRLRGLRDVRLMSFYRMKFPAGTFSTVIMLGNNFGLFGSPTRMERSLKELREITTTDARIIAEFRDPYQTNDPWHRRYHVLNRRCGRMSGQIRLRTRHLGFVDPWLDYLFVSKREMQKLLKGTGWKVRRFFGSGPQYCVLIEKVKS